MKTILATILLLFLSCMLPAQDIGLHPPEVDWQQLRADHVRVIFPRGYASRARRVASLVDRLATDHRRSVGDKLYDFDLILQTPNMTINGYVGLGPFRSEFYVTPPQGFSRLSNTDWVDLLTIHEFRHVQQTSNERRGLTHLASILQGQLGWAVLSGIATPNWFTEGDAVVAETALTASGRGRTPAFSGDLRTLLRQNIIYRYPKARNGSFRSLVPDHYRYGYAMVTYARERFGNDVWKPVLQEGAAFRGLLYPFSRALRRRTGLTTRDLYYHTMADLERLQDSSLQARRPLTKGQPVGATARGDIRDYRFAFQDGSGRLLALRSSYRELPALVEVGTPDRVITRVGIQREPWLAGSGRFVLWTQYGQEPRYTNQSFSDLVVYELGTGRRRKLTDRGHYVSASFSPDERRIVAAWFDPLADSPELHLLDVATGQVLQRRSVAATNLAWPRFAADGERIYFLAQSYEGVAIQAWDPASDALMTLRPHSPEPVDMLTVAPTGELLFSGGRTGVDNIYRMEPATGRVSRLTNVAIGAYYPLLTDSALYYASPTPRGERLHRLPLSDIPAAVPDEEPATPGFFVRPAAFAAEATRLTEDLEIRDYPIRDFSNTLGGIRLHSWSFNGSYVTPGVAVEFANALNTAELVLDGRYNINENRYSGGVTATYGGLYPVVELSGRYRDRNTVAQVGGIDSLAFFSQEYGQLTVGPTVSLPLQWVGGNAVTTLQPGVGYQYYALRGAGEGTPPGNFSNLSLGLSASYLLRTAYRQVQPRWGALATLTYDRALGASAPSGERWLLQGSVFLPGLARTHGIRLDGAVQGEQAENLYQYPDQFRYARGYAAPLNDRVWRLGVNYQLPLLYPDIGLLGITYFKRIRLNAFYDYSRFTIDQPRELSFAENSAGGQLYFDNVWLNAQLITVGVEAAYRFNRDFFSSDEDDLQFRLLLSGSF